MDTKNLEAFMLLYRKKSLRQAAEQLYISPQGLSRLLQNLENELDVILFSRTPKGLEPTAAGEYLYQQAGSVLENHRQLLRNIHRVSGQSKELSFVCSYGVMNALPYSLFLDFQRDNPTFTAKWQEFPDRQAERLLQNNQYGFGLLVLGSNQFNSDYLVTPLFTRKIVLLVYRGHPLYDRETVNLAELKNESIIMEGQEFWIYDFFRSKCISQGFCPNIVAETGDISFCHKLCSLGQGLGISVDFLADFFQTPNVRKINFSDPSLLWPVGLVRHKNTILSPAEERFCQFLKLKKTNAAKL